MNKQYILIDRDGFFWFLHNNKLDLDISSEISNIDNCMKLSSVEVKYIYDNFREKYDKFGIRIHELDLSIGKQVLASQLFKNF